MRMKFTTLLIASIFIVLSCSKDNIIQDPGNVTLLTPLNNELCENGFNISELLSTVTFTWEVSENTTNYDIIIINLINGQEYQTTNILNNTIEQNLTKGFPYSWIVNSNNDESSLQGSSSTWKFFLSSEGITNYTPFPAELIYPQNEQFIESGLETIMLNWLGSDIDDNDLIYTVYIDTINGLQDPLDEYSAITNNQINFNIEPNKTYFWRIKTSDGENSSYSQVYNFHTQ